MQQMIESNMRQFAWAGLFHFCPIHVAIKFKLTRSNFTEIFWHFLFSSSTLFDLPSNLFCIVYEFERQSWMESCSDFIIKERYRKKNNGIILKILGLKIKTRFLKTYITLS